MIETWKAIPGFDGYEASDQGRIRYILRWKTPRILSAVLHQRGYHKVGIAVSGRTKTMFIHRLVALAFLPNPQNLPMVNHLNAIKTDNRPVNLEWVSHRQNVAHAIKHGLYEVGEDHHNCKIPDATVARIRELLSNGLTNVAIASLCGVKAHYIKDIKRGSRKQEAR